MRRLLATLTLSAAAVVAGAPAAVAQSSDLNYATGVAAWRTVVDGVMGGRSSGFIGRSDGGNLLFTGRLSLENNGGFSQIRKSVDGADFAGATGVEARVRGDGRTYQFDIRASDARMMAGGFQINFETIAGEWITVRMPLDDFRLFSFGRRVSNAPDLTPTNIESIGFTLADKNPGAFRLEVESVRPIVPAAVTQASADDDSLVAVAQAAGLDTLLALGEAAGIELPEGQDVTIFAPTDDAFAALPAATVRELMKPESRETLRAILLYHVVLGRAPAADLLTRRTLGTLNGQRLAVGADGAISIGDAGVVTVDVPFDGGIVHVIDTVLMPELSSIADLAGATDQLSTLAAAVGAAGLGEQLGPENGPWTVFAPVNSAFAALPDGVLDSLLETANRDQLVQILGLHLVPGRLYASDLLTSRQARTLFGQPIAFSLENGGITVDGAAIVASDIEASNGVVHLIDSVLLPPSESGSSSSGATRTSWGPIAELIELTIERGAPLFNDGSPEACAAVYEVAIVAMAGLGEDTLGRRAVERLEMALAEAEAEHSWRERAWTYRGALDDVYRMATRNRGAEPRISGVRSSVH